MSILKNLPYIAKKSMCSHDVVFQVNLQGHIWQNRDGNIFFFLHFTGHKTYMACNIWRRGACYLKIVKKQRQYPLTLSQKLYR